jgi:hypothetical protein
LWQFANTPPQSLVYSGIIMEAMREAWTDDRMDDLVKRVDTGFSQAHADTAALRVEIKDLGAEFRTELDSLRGQTSQQFVALNQRFDSLQRTLVGMTFAGFVSLLVAHFA